MSTILLDTNVISEVMLPEPAPTVIAFVNSQSDILISAAVFHELSYGVELMPTGARRARLSAGIAVFRARFGERTIAISAEIAEISGRLRAGEKRSGFVLKPMDALIAASAISTSARLATRNTKDFERLGIELVNPWRG